MEKVDLKLNEMFKTYEQVEIMLQKVENVHEHQETMKQNPYAVI